MRTGPAIAAVLLAAASAAAATPSRSLRLEPKLDKRQPLPAIALAVAFAGKPLSVGVVDGRGADEPQVVGAQKEGATTVYEWRADGPVGPAVERMLAGILRSLAVEVSADGSDAVAADLSRFEVTEVSQTFGSSYQAAVALHLTVASHGARVWSGDVSGTARKSGPDQRPALCNEVLTQALAQALAEVPVPFPAEAEMSAPKPEAGPEAMPPPPSAPKAPHEPPPPGPNPPDKLFADLQRLKAAGLSDETLVSYVREHAPSTPLTADDVLRWKAAGISEAVIRAALAIP